MTFDEILVNVYNTLTNDDNKQSLDLIHRHGIRVENFFLIKLIDKLEDLKKSEKIKSFSVQFHVPNDDIRNHIDLILTDNNSDKFHIELKHFSISRNRNLKFYTNDKDEGKKVGIIKDIEKLNKIKMADTLPDMTNLICFALITPKPLDSEINDMVDRLRGFKVAQNWTINFPIAIENQNAKLGFFYMRRSFKKK